MVDKFDLDMSLLARLGGHSAPRTHRGKERFPGMTITYALIQMVEKMLGLAFCLFVLDVLKGKVNQHAVLHAKWRDSLFPSLSLSQSKTYSKLT